MTTYSVAWRLTAGPQMSALLCCLHVYSQTWPQSWLIVAPSSTASRNLESPSRGEMSSEDPSSSRPPRTLLVYTKKPIEEVRIFDLRGSDIISIREPIEDGTPVSPEEWGFTDPSEDGVCKYCQFMMHPSAPNLIWHQPNVQTLVDSECRFCSWVEVSISKGSDLATSRYRQGDPAFCDPDSTSSRIVLSLSRFPKHTRVVPTVGPRTDFGEMNGVPLNISTLSQLGRHPDPRYPAYVS